MSSLYVRPTAIERHRAAPLREERAQYLAHRTAQGIGPHYVQHHGAMLLHVIRILNLNEPRHVSFDEVERAGELWSADTKHHTNRKAGKHSKHVFVTAATLFLGFHGLLKKDGPEQPFSRQLDQYLRAIKDERGLSTSTVSGSRKHISLFLTWIAKRRATMSEITASDVIDYLNWKRTTCAPRSVVTGAHPLRSFLAYGEANGWCVANLGGILTFPNVRRHNPDRVIPTWHDVRRLLHAETAGRPSDYRTRAMLLLCSIYGLRSSEVVRLRLGDIDWREETLTVIRAKNGRTQVFPLQFEVGEAILGYLVHGRPSCSCRSLFVSLYHPFRSITPTAFATVTAVRMKLLGVRSSNMGPHSLRHACATQLLRTGSSLRQIADFLGHRDLNTVSIYARLDAAALLEVAAFSLRGVL